MDLMGFPLALFADASAAGNAMQSYIKPVMMTIIAISSLAVVFFLVNGGIQYMTSSGNPERLEHAKKIIRNALIGLALVIAAATLTAILSHAYNGSGGAMTEKLPTLNAIEPDSTSGGLVDVLINAVVGLLKNIIESAAKPFLDALNYFTNATPLMAENSGVFNLWLAIVAIADVLFILVVALLGFHVMSYATFGLEEVEFKHLLPRLALIFLLMNTSIFTIDAIISLSNGMIGALKAGFPMQSVWDVLKGIVDKSGALGLAALLLMIVFTIIAVMLLVYYVLRMVVLYIGAVLSPIVFLIWLLPTFKEFAENAIKTYLTTIFVLFIHVVILQLAASIFGGMKVTGGDELNPMMSMIVGVATLLALLKTQGVLSQMSYMSLGPKTASKLGSQLTNVISHYSTKKSRSVTHTKSTSRNNPNQTGGSRPTVIQMRDTKPAKATKSTASTPPPTGETRKAPIIGKADKK